MVKFIDYLNKCLQNDEFRKYWEAENLTIDENMEKSYFIHDIDWDIDTADDLKRLPVATTLTIEVEENETEMEIVKRL